MKKIVSDFIKDFGCTTHYSGKKRKMYIRGKNAEEAEMQAIGHFGFGLPFTLDKSSR